MTAQPSTAGCVVWFTGVPAAGKSTLAGELAGMLTADGIATEILDGEDIRAMISPDLGFSDADRDLNTKRLAYVAQLLARHGVVVIVAAVSNRRAHRDRARRMSPGGRFVEVYVRCSLEECKRRDPNGLYKRGERGEISDIAGWHQPYEAPAAAEVTVNTEAQSPRDAASAVLAVLREKEYVGGDVVRKASGKAADAVKERLRGLGYID